MLFEALLRFADENEQLALMHWNERDALAFCLGGQNTLKTAGGDKQRVGVLPLSSGLMRLASQLGGEAATKPMNWSLKLEHACDSLNMAFLAFDEEAFAILGKADDLLAKPPRSP